MRRAGAKGGGYAEEAAVTHLLARAQCCWLPTPTTQSSQKWEGAAASSGVFDKATDYPIHGLRCYVAPPPPRCCRHAAAMRRSRGRHGVEGGEAPLAEVPAKTVAKKRRTPAAGGCQRTGSSREEPPI